MPSPYKSVSFWLETCGDDLTPRRELTEDMEVDVAVLGGGYSGLWTAYYLLREEPGLAVTILEGEIVGFGASGRNGGWCSAGFPVSLPELARRYGIESTRRLHAAMIDSVDEVGRVAGREDIDIHYRRGGALRIARGEGQRTAVEQSYRAYENLGLAEGYRVLTRQQVEARVRVHTAEGGLFTPHCAAIHPGRLVRGLARAVERMGATIHERSRVVTFGERPELALRTNKAQVRARRAVVLAGEAYLSRLRPLHRQLLPVYSLIVLTEPISDRLWDEIGWAGHECLGSFRLTVDYLIRTNDGRVLFGSRGAPYHFGSRISPAFDRNGRTEALIRSLVLDWFPMLRGVRFTHAWGGPVGMPRDWMPAISFDPHRGMAAARGYTGQGVATANLAGRILADLILERASDLTTLPPVNRRSPNWEPEPFRWLVVRGMQRAFAHIDRRMERTGRAPSGRSIPERLARH